MKISNVVLVLSLNLSLLTAPSVAEADFNECIARSPAGRALAGCLHDCRVEELNCLGLNPMSDKPPLMDPQLCEEQLNYCQQQCMDLFSFLGAADIVLCSLDIIPGL